MKFIKDKSRKGTLPEEELRVLHDFVKTSYWRDAFDQLELEVLKKKKTGFSIYRGLTTILSCLI